jgi:hypothetical protein
MLCGNLPFGSQLSTKYIACVMRDNVSGRKSVRTFRDGHLEILNGSIEIGVERVLRKE